MSKLWTLLKMHDRALRGDIRITTVVGFILRPVKLAGDNDSCTHLEGPLPMISNADNSAQPRTIQRWDV